MRRKRHPQDIETDPPHPAIRYLWVWFHELTRGRPIAGTGHYLPIPSAEILAWQTLAKVELQDWELTVIRRLDSAFLKIMAETTEE